MKRWIPGLAVLAAMLGTGALVGARMGPRFWPLFLVLALCGLGVVGWLTHTRMRSRPAPVRKGKARRAEDEPYDLEKDTTTDEQRWLM